MNIPLDLISFVQPLRSSWISSGSTSFRSQASGQRGFGGGGGGVLPLRFVCFLFLEVGPPPRSREKKGILGERLGECWINLVGDHASKRCSACASRALFAMEVNMMSERLEGRPTEAINTWVVVACKVGKASDMGEQPG